MTEHRLEPEIYSHKILDELIQQSPQNIKIHLKLDTGMHRLGFSEEQIESLIQKLKKHPYIHVATVFSHLVGADEALHNEFSQTQYSGFVAMYERIAAAVGYRPTRHLLNSAGIIRFPEYKLDMVRLGIGLYGVEVNQYQQRSLQNVGTLKTVISQIKHLKAGETVGYSRRGLLTDNRSIATIAIGYADGYDRRFGNGVGHVWLNGTLCPTVGNVCMDMTMVDVTNAHAQEGDDVVVFGKELSISTLAQQIGTIAYEILTGVSERVKRVFFKE